MLLDVRERWEYEEANLGGLNIPLGGIRGRIDELPKDQLIVVHCRSGRRSAKAAQWLVEAHLFREVYNLKGGILAYLALPPDEPSGPSSSRRADNSK